MVALLHYIGGFTPLLLNYLKFNLDILCIMSSSSSISFFELLSQNHDVELPT